MKTLFPFLEERRAEIITQRRNRLSVPHLRPNGNKEPIVISEFEDLEWGDISHQYRTNRRVNAEWAEFADHMHNIRNDLAHLRPVVDTRSLTPKILDFSLNS